MRNRKLQSFVKGPFWWLWPDSQYAQAVGDALGRVHHFGDAPIFLFAVRWGTVGGWWRALPTACFR